MIVAGEASGDMHAAHLIDELRQLDPGIRVRAMGGQALARAGAEILVDNRELAVVGLVEVLRHYPDIRRALKRLQTELDINPPDLLILVDYVEFNLKLARHARRRGVKVLFYISPQVWAWRQGRVKKIGERIDMMAVIFPFEVEFYRRHGIPVRYVGNPLTGKVKATRSLEENRRHFGIDASRPVIGLQPGSRRSEISRLAPLFHATAQRIRQQRPEIQFLLPVAPGLQRRDIETLIPGNDFIRLIEHESPYDVMQVCDAILTACGTATLETGLMGIPMAVAYRVSPLSYAILSRLVRIPHVALVNIVAGREIVREFIQNDARPSALVDEMLALIENPNYRDDIIAGLAGLKEKLGPAQGSRKIAELALEMLQRHQATTGTAPSKT